MRLCITFFILGLSVLFLWGCEDSGTGGGGFIPTGNIIAVAERSGSNQTIQVGGTPGSVPAGSLVDVTNRDTGKTQTTVGESDGSFDPTFMGSTNDLFNVKVTSNGTVVEDTVIGVTLLSQAVKRDLAVLGSVPASIEIRGNRAYVVNGFSNNIQIFDLDQDPPQEIGTIVLPPNSNPVAMAFLDDTRAYVANNIGQSVALVNVQTRQCELIIVRTGEGTNFPPCQEVRFAVGAFEDPSDVAIANEKVYVSNSNRDEFFVPLPNGFISIINSVTNQFMGTITASGADSAGLTVIDDNIYVVNSGNVLFDSQTNTFTCDFDFPPSIDVLNTQTDNIIDTIEIPLSEENNKVCPGGDPPNRIAPTPDQGFGYIRVGLVGALLKINLDTNTLVNGTNNPIIVTDISGLDNTADVQINGEGLGFITLFNSDQIAVIDTTDDEISPFPFSFFFPAGIRADNPNSDLFDGVQRLAIIPGIQGIDFQGADIFYTTGISSKLGSVNTSLVLPPQ
ncbi:hypothetical protein MYX76_00805 [Desulfobacterota bacterium AH_259_B03_O07]|nr:hypothetical protein [Desulfobacterota bacterium AH_259_B03_O07]